MKLIIDIPKDKFNNRTLVNFFGCYSDKLDSVIYNGTPLPEHHGRLIDADDIEKHIVGSVDTRDCPTIIEGR